MASRVAILVCVMVAMCCFMSFAMMRAEATTIRMRNNCSSTVCFKRWGPRNGVGGACSQQGPGGTWTQTANSSWSAVTMWAIPNTGCAGQNCNIGPPLAVTQIVISIADDGFEDLYEVTKIVGYNVAMKVVPTNGNCPTAQCTEANSGPCYYVGGPDETKACPTGSTDYDVYTC